MLRPVLWASDLFGQVVRHGPARIIAVTTLDAAQLLRLYADLGDQVAVHRRSGDAFAGITKVAVTAVPGTSFASITRGRADHFQTLAPTDSLATAADRLQYELDSGPCVASIDEAGAPSFVSNDIAADGRWPVYGPRVAAEFGVRSMVSVRMTVDADVAASLNLYSRETQAFSEHAQTVAMLLATHAGVVLGGILARERVEHLEAALRTSRRIGMAIGVLMTGQKVTADQAFDLLRIASQSSNRRISTIAEDVLETGQLGL